MIREILSLIGSLVLIVLIIVFTYYATRWYARRAGRSSSGKYIKVLDRSVLGTGSSVAIVRIEDKYYLLGVAEKSVNMLCQLDGFVEQDENNPDAVPVPQAFRQILDKAWSGRKKDGDDRP